VRQINFTDPNPPRDRRKDPEKVKLLTTEGTADDWGELEPLRGTTWADGVRVVPATELDHALHGRLHPLLSALGREPRASARRVSDKEGICQLQDICPTYQEGYCRPGSLLKKKQGPPECYEAPLNNAPPELRQLFYEVVMAWRENRHTIVVVGERFNLG